MPPGKKCRYPGLRRRPRSFFLLSFSLLLLTRSLLYTRGVQTPTLSLSKSTTQKWNETVIFGRRCETRDYFRTGGSIIPPRATKCESSSFRVSSDRDAWASSEGLISTYGKQCHVENSAGYVRNGTIYFLRVSVFVRFDRLEKWREDFHFFSPTNFSREQQLE